MGGGVSGVGGSGGAWFEPSNKSEPTQNQNIADAKSVVDGIAAAFRETGEINDRAVSGALNQLREALKDVNLTDEQREHILNAIDGLEELPTAGGNKLIAIASIQNDIEAALNP